LKPTLYLINEIKTNNNNTTSIERKIYLNADIFHPTILARPFSSLEEYLIDRVPISQMIQELQ